MKTSSFIILFFALSFCLLNAQQEIPSQVRDALQQKPGAKNQLVAFVSEKNADYYLIREIGPKGGDELEVNQILVVDKKNQLPKIIARKPNIFPLSQYELPDALVKELAEQYVQDAIRQTPQGVKGVQKIMDYNPKFIPSTPELIEAYRNAGINIP